MSGDSANTRSQVAVDRTRHAHRTILVGGLLLTGILWSAIWLAHAGHAAGPHLSAASSTTLATAGASVLLWMVMMAAMMTPAALPWLGLLATTPRSGGVHPGATDPVGALGGGGSEGPYLRASSLLCGYLTVWGLFSVLAAATQLLLLRMTFLEPIVLRLTGPAAGTVLLAAGLWELSPIKEACLRRCRSPFAALLAEWASGPAPAYRIGLRQGVACVSCCWALMGVVFVVGVVSLGWMAALTAVVCAEKLLPRAHLLSRLLGVGLASAGIALLISPG